MKGSRGTEKSQGVGEGLEFEAKEGLALVENDTMLPEQPRSPL